MKIYNGRNLKRPPGYPAFSIRHNTPSPPPPPATGNYITENSSGNYITEDSSGNYITEASAALSGIPMGLTLVFTYA